MDTITCCRCGRTQSTEQFYRNARRRSGRQPHCKTCHRDAYRASKRAYMRSEAGREKGRASSKRWAARNQDRVRAYRKLQYEVESGRVRRPDGCSRCGAKRGPGVIIDGHHPDYSKPLDVVWLCRGCHRLEHSGQAAGVMA